MTANDDHNRTPLLSVRHLCVDFPTDKTVLHAVEDVSFDVFPGETLGLVGESGCGKSVTCMSILRLHDERSVSYAGGEILFGETDLLRAPAKMLRSVRGREISMIFQEPMTALNPLYSVGNQMGEAVRIHEKMAPSKIRHLCADMLRRVNIPNPEEILERYPFSLSGGMRQRVMIAMALLTGPKLVIADEPTTALDVTIQAQVLDVMRNLQKELGCSYIFITHDLGVISEMADRVAVMYGGHICECAETDTLFEEPLHPYTRGLIGSRPAKSLTADRLTVIPGNVPSLQNKPAGCPFHTRCAECRDVCREHFPKTVEAAPGHTVACHLYTESGSTAL
ncbi:MAG: ABC transporter ATP-binding protein [Lachnospiraceae bacterium]|nr:ABC transporter ATP-binding protein [Lachnospiraceae bacterium]